MDRTEEVSLVTSAQKCAYKVQGMKPNQPLVQIQNIYIYVIRAVIEGKDVPQHVIDKQSGEVQALSHKASSSRAKVSGSDIIEVIGEAKGNRAGDRYGNQQEAKSYFR